MLQQALVILVSTALCMPHTGLAQPIVIGTGNYPDVAVDGEGGIHLVYGRGEQLLYRAFDPIERQWKDEVVVPLTRQDGPFGLSRSDPDIVVDSRGHPHVHAWDGYGHFDGKNWHLTRLPRPVRGIFRDSELAIDSKDNVYLTRRGGFHGGNVGLLKKGPGESEFAPLADPDEGLTSPQVSNHVYSDLAVGPADDSLHVIQRHGPNRTTAYRYSSDAGRTWTLRNTVCREEPEAPHILATVKGEVIGSNGFGECFRLTGDTWISDGQPITVAARSQPELSADGNGDVYIAAFGGKLGVRRHGQWGSSLQISSVTGKSIGFVETAGAADHVVAVWEEGDVVDNHNEVKEPVSIVVAKILPDGSQLGPDVIERFGTLERSLRNTVPYTDPYRDVRLNVDIEGPGTNLTVPGFYDGQQTWRFRFRGDRAGRYRYAARFSDGSLGQSGCFHVSEQTSRWGPIRVSPTNPVWFARGDHPLQLRALHVGDRFMASNWDERKRQAFLRWFQEQGYNTISVASHYLNRDEEDRGRGWETPDLWPLSPAEYGKMEAFLRELDYRGIIVFPFAGFIGKNSDYPRDEIDQALYVRYTMARIGHFGNLLYNVAGPEPNLKNAWFPADDVERLGRLIRDSDVYGHPLTVHNRTGDDPYRDSDWTTFGTLQGPKTVDRQRLSRGLLESHHPAKPLFAQETLWSGNMYHVMKNTGKDYSDDDVRKNAFVIAMSGASFCFADNQGNSSSGFSGSLELADRMQHRHDIIRKVWDLIDTLPYHTMTPRQDLVDRGYCLACPGRAYLVYLETGGDVSIRLDGRPMTASWIQGGDTSRRVQQGPFHGQARLSAPDAVNDWLLFLSVELARGS